MPEPPCVLMRCAKLNAKWDRGLDVAENGCIARMLKLRYSHEGDRRGADRTIDGRACDVVVSAAGLNGSSV